MRSRTSELRCDDNVTLMDLKIICFVCYVTVKVWLQTTIATGFVGSLLQYSSRALVLFFLLTSGFWSSAPSLLLFGLLGIIAWNTRSNLLVSLVIVAYSIRHVPLWRILRAATLAIAVNGIFVALLATLSIIPDTVIDIGSVRGERLSFGFLWPSRLQVYILSCLLCYIGWRRESSSWITVATYCAVSHIVYQETDARFPYYFTILLSIIVVVFKVYLPRSGSDTVRRGAHLHIAPLFVLLCVVFAISIAFFYDDADPRWINANSLLSGRLELSQAAIIYRPLTLFGNYISAHQGEYLSSDIGYFDCGYLEMLYSFGALPFLVFVALMIRAAYRESVNHDLFSNMALCIIAVFTIFYPHMIEDISYAPYLTLLFMKAKNSPKIYSSADRDPCVRYIKPMDPKIHLRNHPQSTTIAY